MSIFWTSDRERLHRARVRAFIPSRRATASDRDATVGDAVRVFVIGLVIASIALTALCLAFQHVADTWPNHATQSDQVGSAAPHVIESESSRSGGAR